MPPKKPEKTKAEAKKQPTIPTSKPTKKLAKVLSLHAHKAEKAEKQTKSLEIRHKQLISAAKANAMVAESIFQAVLGAIRCQNMAQLRTYLQTDFQKNLSLQASRLILAPLEENPITSITLEPLQAEKHRPYFGPKTNQLKSVCLLTLTTQQGETIGLLALGSNQADRFHVGQATELANFLRQALSEIIYKLNG